MYAPEKVVKLAACTSSTITHHHCSCKIMCGINHFIWTCSQRQVVDRDAKSAIHHMNQRYQSCEYHAKMKLTCLGGKKSSLVLLYITSRSITVTFWRLELQSPPGNKKGSITKENGLPFFSFNNYNNIRSDNGVLKSKQINDSEYCFTLFFLLQIR